MPECEDACPYVAAEIRRFEQAAAVHRELRVTHRERIAELEQALAAAQQAQRDAEARNPEVGYGYYHHNGISLTQGDGMSTVMLYHTDELQVEINRERKRAEAAEAERDEAIAALARAREALEEYSEHSVACSDALSYGGAKCICGYAAALEATQPRETN